MRGIKKQILFPVLGVIFVSLLAAVSIVSYMANQALMEAGREKILNAAIHVGNTVLEKVNRAKADVLVVTRIPVLRQVLNPAETSTYPNRDDFIRSTNRLMTELGEVGGYYETFYVVSESGLTLTSSLESTVNQLDISNRDWFHEAMKSKDVVISEPFRSRITGDALVAVAKKFGYGTYQGAAVGSLQIQKITKDALIVENSEWLRTVIVSKSGMTLSALDDAEVGKKSYHEEPWFTQMINEKKGSIDINDNGVDRLLVFYNLPNTDFYAVSFADKDVLLKPSRIVMIVSALALALVVALSFVIIYFIVTPISNSIHSLATYAKEVGEGRLDADPVALHRQDELGVLADSINKMVTTLRQLIVKSEAATQAKIDFLSWMGHEIRTPITGTVGMSKVALKLSDLGKIHGFIRRIDSSSKLLLGLINSILDISKIETSKLELAHEPFDFEKMLIEVSNVISVKSEEKQQKFDVHMDVSMQRYFKGDEMRLSQVITNLLSNAVKFTPQAGKIEVTVQEKAIKGNCSQIEIKISDTGIGISKEQQYQLSKPYEQSEGMMARRFGGTGMGLAISRNIVQMMGGDVQFESAPGVGSIFTFDILLERDSAPQNTVEMFNEEEASRLHVLLLSSEADTSAYFGKIMDGFGIRYKVVQTAVEAVQALESSSEFEGKHEMLFVDWSITDVPPSDLCLHVRRKFGCPVIGLMSILQWSEIESKAANFGITQHATKPLFASDIQSAINNELTTILANKKTRL